MCDPIRGTGVHPHGGLHDGSHADPRKTAPNRTHARVRKANFVVCSEAYVAPSEVRLEVAKEG
jgi:hypothetical protein